MSFISTNILYNTSPFFIHCPGISKENNTWKNLKFFFENNINKKNILYDSIDDISIITWNNSIQKSIFEISCDYFNMRYLVLGSNIKDWNNLLKISLLYEYLNECKTKYILAIDAYDAVMLRPINENIKKILINNNIKLIYNKTRIRSWPELNEFYGNDYKFDYLNSGAFFGEVNFVKFFLKNIMETTIINNSIFNKVRLKNWRHDTKYSDQTLIKIVANKFYEHIDLDHKYELFQILHSKGDNGFSLSEN